MSTKGEKRDARKIQRYTGASYTTALRWVRIIREEGLEKAEYEATGCTDRDKNMRVALHKRFPDVVIEMDSE